VDESANLRNFPNYFQPILIIYALELWGHVRRVCPQFICIPNLLSRAYFPLFVLKLILNFGLSVKIKRLNFNFELSDVNIDLASNQRV
jgi:hypothetical protein